MAIKRDIEITIKNDTATFREPLYVYQDDRNVELYISIRDNKYRYTSNVNSTILKTLTNAYANATVLKPNGTSFKTYISNVEDDKIKFVIKKEFTDELEEIGIYKMQFHLYDDAEETARITIPPVEFEVKRLIYNANVDEESMAGKAIVGVAEVSRETLATLELKENKVYIKTEWETGDIITANKLNKIEDKLEELDNIDIEIKKTVEEKIDKEVGKGLSENNFTTEEKNKLSETTVVTEEEKETWNNKSKVIEINSNIEEDLLLNADISEGQIMNSSGNLSSSDIYNNYIIYAEQGTYIANPKTRNIFAFENYPGGKTCDIVISNKSTTSAFTFTLDKPYYLGINYFIEGSNPKLLKEGAVGKDVVKIPKLEVDVDNLSTELLEIILSKKYYDLEVTKKGEIYSIRSKFDSNRDIISEVSRSGSNNGAFNFIRTLLINKNEIDLSKATVIANSTDDIAPIRTFVTIGANHGYTTTYEVICEHDKTSKDLGSMWTGSDTATLTLINIEVGKLTFLTNYSETDGIITANTLGTINNTLTHLSGATNLANITVVSSKSVQLYPSISNISCSFMLDGKNIIEDGVYCGKELRVKESYNIMCYKEIIDAIQNNTGTHYTELNIAPAVRITIDYLYTKGCNCFISYNIRTFKKILFGNCGYVQSAIISSNGKNIYRYLPNVKIADGVDFSKLYDMGKYVADLRLFSSSFTDPKIPPDRCVDWVGEDVNNKDYGFIMGYIVDKTDSNNVERVKNGGGWDMRRTKKSYPIASTKLTLEAGTTKTYSCYRNWMAGEYVEDASVFNIVYDKKDTYIYIDYHKDIDFKNFYLDEHLGKDIEIIQSKNFTLHNNIVNSDGVLFSINNSYGYAILKIK